MAKEKTKTDGDGKELLPFSTTEGETAVEVDAKKPKRTKAEQEQRAERLNEQMERLGLGVDFIVNGDNRLYLNSSSWRDVMCLADTLTDMEETPSADDDPDLAELAKPDFGNAWIEFDDETD